MCYRPQAGGKNIRSKRLTMNIKDFYYKKYFSKVNFTFLINDKDKNSKEDAIKIITLNNKKLCDAKLERIIPSPIEKTDSFRLKVDYPGLITGVGIGHEAKIDGEFKLGMHFDHTTGMPIIYGSSVKGVLKSYFEEEYSGPNKERIKNDIFEGFQNVNGKKIEKPIYERDIFFDAVIVEANRDGKILASDSITPHVQGPLKNPIPITFMKIASGCVLEFRFKLVDTKIDGETVLDKDKKLEIFKEILTTYGIGAKTNVGYGQLSSKVNG